MDASRYFVLIASPEAASRPWVNKEIAYWLDNNTPETLIIVAAQGEVSWDRAGSALMATCRLLALHRCCARRWPRRG
jgi:hypothetical protein